MNLLIEQHIAAEMASDAERAAAMQTDEVIDDAVGTPHGPVQGRDASPLWNQPK